MNSAKRPVPANLRSFGRFRVYLAVLVAMAMFGAACSSDDETSTALPTATAIADVEEAPAEAPEPSPEPTVEPVPAEAPEPSPEPAPTEAPEPSPEPAAGQDDFDLTAILSDQVGDSDGGIAALVTRNGITTLAAAGSASPTNDLESDDIFRVGSISKTFVSTMVMQQVDEGLVDLEAPLSTYLADTPLGADVTVRQLLSHRSGIPSYTDQPSFIPFVLGRLDRSFEPAEILDFVIGVEGRPAGDGFQYSNTNYVLLGQLVEAIDDRPLEESLQARIAGPGNLTSTSFDDPADLVGGWSPGLLDGEPVEYEGIRSSAWAAGALTSNVADLATFLDLLFAGEMMSEESLTELTTMNDGYGLGLMTLDFGPGIEAYGHNGGIPGFLSGMAIDPLTGDTIVVLSNNDLLDPTQAAFAIIGAW